MIVQKNGETVVNLPVYHQIQQILTSLHRIQLISHTISGKRSDHFMLFKLIALDIDGTLTNSRKTVSEKTREQLIKYQKNGGTIVLASGRPLQGILPYAKTLRLREFGGYILAYNGGCIIECATGKVIYQDKFPLKYIPEVFDIIKNYPVGINTYQDDKIIAGNTVNKYTEIEAKINGMELSFKDNFVEYVNFDITKCLLHGEPEIINELEKILGEKFGKELGIFKSEPFFLEIVPKEIDKAKSLSRLLKVLSLHKDECIAFGDGFNDISMLKYAGLGVAMSNASDTVKNSADYVAGSNDEDGIAVLLSEMGRSVFPSLAML